MKERRKLDWKIQNQLRATEVSGDNSHSIKIKVLRLSSKTKHSDRSRLLTHWHDTWRYLYLYLKDTVTYAPCFKLYLNMFCSAV